MSVLGGSEHSFEQQGVLCDPLMGFGQHVSEPHPVTLRVSLHPLDRVNAQERSLVSWCFSTLSFYLTLSLKIVDEIVLITCEIKDLDCSN